MEGLTIFLILRDTRPANPLNQMGSLRSRDGWSLPSSSQRPRLGTHQEMEAEEGGILIPEQLLGIEDQLRFGAIPHSGAGACPSTKSPRSGQGRDRERKAREGSEPGSGLFSCGVEEF